MEQKLFVHNKCLKYAERKEKYCKKINSDFYVFYSRVQTVKYNSWIKDISHQLILIIFLI